MIEHDHSMIAGLGAKLAASKSTVALGTFIGVLAFELSTLGQGNIWIGIATSAVCSVIVAWFSNRPKLISAHSQAQVSERQQAMTEWTNLLKQQQDAANLQITRMREKIDQQDAVMALMRISKHNALGEYNAACLHIQMLNSVLKDNELTIPQFNFKTAQDITNMEDVAIAKMMQDHKFTPSHLV